MRADRNPYPFHNRQPQRPAVSMGYKPAPMRPCRSNRRVLANLVGYCAAVSIAVVTFVGFIAH
jgi:hypothetical protein